MEKEKNARVSPRPSKAKAPLEKPKPKPKPTPIIILNNFNQPKTSSELYDDIDFLPPDDELDDDLTFDLAKEKECSSIIFDISYYDEEFNDFQNDKMINEMRSVLIFYLFFIGPLLTCFTLNRSPGQPVTIYASFGISYVIILTISLWTTGHVENFEDIQSKRMWNKFIAAATILSVTAVNVSTMLVQSSDNISPFFVLILSLVFQYQISMPIAWSGVVLFLTLIVHNLSWLWNKSGNIDYSFITGSFALGAFTYFNGLYGFFKDRSHFRIAVEQSIDKKYLKDRIKGIAFELCNINVVSNQFKRGLNSMEAILEKLTISRVVDEQRALNDMIAIQANKSNFTRWLSSSWMRRSISFFGCCSAQLLLGFTLNYYNSNYQEGIWAAIACSMSLTASDFLTPDDFFAIVENSYLSPVFLQSLFHAKCSLSGLQILPITILYCIIKPHGENLKGIVVLLTVGSQFFGIYWLYRPSVYCLVFSFLLCSQYLIMELASQDGETLISLLARVITCVFSNVSIVVCRFQLSPLQEGIQAMIEHRNHANSMEIMAAMDQFQTDLVGQLNKSNCRTISRNFLIKDEVKLGRLVGGGRYGDVFHGSWRGTTVAVKILTLSVNTSTDDFLNEMELLSILKHPNIISFMGSVYNGKEKNAWLVTEFVENGSLWDFMRNLKQRVGSLSLTQKIVMCIEATDGLKHLHLQTNPIVHGDMKSPNLFVTKHLEVKVGDLGTSQRLARGMTLEQASPIWVSPEVFRGKNLTEKIDVYSMGIIMWEICTGDIPYENVDVRSIPFQVVSLHVRPPLEKVSQLNKSLSELISRCWSEKGDVRPTSLLLGETLRKILKDVKGLENQEMKNDNFIVNNRMPIAEKTDDTSAKSIERESASGAVELNDVARTKGNDLSLSNSAYLMEFLRIKEEDVQIVNEIGRGSNSRVCKGRYRSTTVAVRCFKQDYYEFLIDLHFQFRLIHPNINSIIGYIANNNSRDIKMVLKYMERGNLFNVLHQPLLKLTLTTKIHMAIDAAKGLCYLHLYKPNSIIHRDLKSQNLLVGYGFNVAVADLGLSRTLTTTSTMTRCGTPYYVAPEIIKGLAYSEACDVYSFGIVLYEILTRREPYKHDEKYKDDNVTGIINLMNDICSGLRPSMQTYLSIGKLDSDATKFSHYLYENTTGLKDTEESKSEIVEIINIERLCAIISLCWKEKPEERLAISDILRDLESIVIGLDLV